MLKTYSTSLSSLINKDFSDKFDDLMKKDIERLEKTIKEFKDQSSCSLDYVTNLSYVHYIASCSKKTKEKNYNTYLLTSLIEPE